MKMKLITFLIIIQTFSLSISSLNVIESKQYKNREKRAPRCQIKIFDCNQAINIRKSYHFYYETLEKSGNCGGSILGVRWSILKGNRQVEKLPQFNDKEEMYLQPRFGPPGIYYIRAVAQIQKQVYKAVCKIRYESEPPIILFKNGRVQHIKAGTFVTVDITESKTFGSVLKPQWSMECELYNRPTQICLKLPCVALSMQGMKFKVLHHSCHKTLIFSCSYMFGKKEYEVKQIVYVSRSITTQVRITCLVNCDRNGAYYSNQHQEILLRVECIKNCYEFKHLPTPTWKIIDLADGDEIIAGFEVKNEGRIFSIAPNTLESNGRYLVSCESKRGRFKSSYIIVTIGDLTPPECDVQPRKGYNLYTIFTMKCKPIGHFLEYAPTYYLYYIVSIKKVDTDILITESAHNTIRFRLCKLKNKRVQAIKVVLVDIYKNELHVDLPGIVLQLDKTKPDSASAHANNIVKLCKGGRYVEGISYLNAFFLRRKVSNTKLVEGFNMKIIRALLDIPLDSKYLADLLIVSLDRFIDFSIDDHEYVALLGKLCAKVSKLEVEKLKASEYNKLAKETVLDYAETLQKCGDYILNQVGRQIIIHENATYPPYVHERVVEEHYPDYDENYVSPQVEEMKDNAIKTIIHSSEAILKTLSPTQAQTVLRDNSKTKIIVNDPEFLEDAMIDFDDVHLQIVQGAKVAGAMVTVFNESMLNLAPVSSRIIDVNFFDKDMKNVNATFYVNFTLKSEEIPFLDYRLSVPSIWKAPKINLAMHVHRMELFARKSGVIRLAKMSPDDVFVLIMTVNVRPKIQHFKGNKGWPLFIVYGNDTETQLINYPFEPKPYDQFFYVAILPHANLINDSVDWNNFTYAIQFSEQSCVVFDKFLNRWDSANCKVYYTPNPNARDQMDCTCKHTSLYAALSKAITHKFDVIDVVQFEIVQSVNYIIFLHTAIVFALYCIALLFVRRRQPHSLIKNKLYFLSDNVKNDRYAYLIYVKTGKYIFAGTTSNVMIRLHGDEHISKPHVLNYPDPNLKILQCDGTDWFILTTSHHLGNIIFIQIWFDGIGLGPAWFCEDISIIDLQTKDEWYFKVNTWLSIKQGKFQLKVKPCKFHETKDNIAEMIKKHIKFSSGPELTWNIFSKDHDAVFQFRERLTIILSMIFTTYFLNMIMFAQPHITVTDAFGYGHFQFYWNIITFAIASSFLSTAINLPFVYVFRNCKRQSYGNCLIEDIKTIDHKYWILTWFALVCWIAFCAIMLTILGLWVTFSTSYLWIISTILSLLLSIFIIENAIIRLPYNFSAILQEVERQRILLFKKFGELLFRPYFQPHYKKLTRDALQILKEYEIIRVEVAELFRDMCLFILYIILIYALILIELDTNSYLSNRGIRDLVEFGPNENEGFYLHRIETIEDIYRYINRTIIGITHPNNWYGKYYTSDGGLMADFNTRILGVVQLRQQRRQQVCTLPPLLKNLSIVCSNDAPIFNKWPYFDGKGVTFVSGHLEIYSGEGYIVHLGRNLYNSMYVLNLLKRGNWIDINTKVLFIEFWTFNANSNLFNAIRIVIERDVTGRVLTTSQIATARLMYNSHVEEGIVITLLLTLIVLIAFMTAKRIFTYTSRKLFYLKSFWNVIDILLCLLSIIVVILYFVKASMTRALLTELVNSDNNEFVNFFELFTLLAIRAILSAILLCLATIRLWKFLRFGILFQVMERTLLNSFVDVFYIVICHTLIFLMFTMFFYIVYGQNFYSFRTFSITLTSLFLVSINYIRQINKNAFPLYGPLIYGFYITFMIVSICFITVYATVIILHFEESKLYFSNRFRQYNIKTYISEKFYYYLEKIKRQHREFRLGGGKGVLEDSKFLYPKADAQRYADCAIMDSTRLRLMKVASIAVLRNLRRHCAHDLLDENDYLLMARIVLLLRLKDEEDDEKHLFFKTSDPMSGLISYVSDNRIRQMEYAVNCMLTPQRNADELEDDRVIIHRSGDADRLQVVHDAVNLINTTIQNVKIVEKEKTRRRGVYNK